MSRPRRGPFSLSGWLFAAIALVITVGLATAWAVATTVAPRVFHDHLHSALPRVSTDLLLHADRAFTSANAIAAGAAASTALMTSTLVTAYLVRRLSRSFQPMAAAAASVAAGRYDVRIDRNGLSSEMADVTDAFNDMAARLERDEESRARLLADVAHELRTPVATLNAYVEALADGVAELDDEAITVLRSQTVRLERLADDIAAVSLPNAAQTPLRMTVLDPVRLAATAAASVSDRYAAKGVRLRVDSQDPVASLEGDEDRLGQVLTNLLENALAHTPQDGSVSVSVRSDARSVEWVVTDTGSGIVPDQLSRIFERFYRVSEARERSSGGTGLGLAIARSLVQAHGGHIWAESRGKGGGSAFTVRLPRTPASRRAAWPAKPPTGPRR